MKRFLKYTLLFALFAPLFYLCVLFLWGQFVPPPINGNLKYVTQHIGFFDKRLAEFERIDSVEILFLGSSHTYRGFDTRIFSAHGISSFNLGSSAQTPVETLLLLQTYLDSIDVDLAVFEVYPITFSIDGVESSMDVISAINNDWPSYQMARKINQIKTYNTLIYVSMREFFNLKHSPVEGPTDKEKYISGGYVERELEFATPLPMPKEKSDIVILPYQLAAFNDALDMLSAQNIQVVLVFAPVPSAVYQGYADIEEFDSLMHSHGPYYNFNEILNTDDSLHFFDADHLNQIGVNLFNEKLIEILKRDSIIEQE